MEISFDPESLTAREIFAIEDYTGTKFEDLLNKLDVRALVAIAFVVLKRDDPEGTPMCGPGVMRVLVGIGWSRLERTRRV